MTSQRRTTSNKGWNKVEYVNVAIITLNKVIYFNVDLNNVKRRNNVVIFNVDFHNVGQRWNNVVNITIEIK